MKRYLPWVWPVVVFITVLIVWDVAVRYFQIHKVILPRPTDIAFAFYKERWTLLKGSWITFQSSGTGLLVSGLLGGFLAMLFSQSKAIRVSLYPYVIFLQTVPIVAIAPLLILWFGNKFHTVVLVSTIISIFPVISNMTSGLLSVNDHLLDYFKLQRASRLQVLFKLRFPFSLPYWILGLRISCGLAVIGAIVGEFFVGDRGNYEGLGTIITARQGNLNTSSMMAAVIACTMLGLLLLLVVNLLGNVVLRRWTQGVGFEGSERN